MPARTYGPFSRRTFLRGAAAGGVLVGMAPAIVVAERGRPQTPSGLMVGDVTGGRALVWSRTDRPCRMQVRWDTTESFLQARRTADVDALSVDDFVARLELADLPAGQDIFVEVTFLELAGLRSTSVPLRGHFRTPPTDPKASWRVAWGGDTCGQGWGINPDWGGLRMYNVMRQWNPDLFIHSGDTIYADGPLQERVTLADGSIWKNIVTPAKAHVAQTLADFRGNHAYNLMDHNVQAFNATVAQSWQWDDHEVMNNWHPGMDLSADGRYQEKRIGVLAARSRRAFLDYAPIRRSLQAPDRIWRSVACGPHIDVFILDLRSHRGANGFHRQKQSGPHNALLGTAQLDWLMRSLKASTATWKILATDMPLGLLVADGKDAQGRPQYDNAANGNGPALGRELEYATLLRFLQQQGVGNTVWITADVHYAAAHHYDPARARFGDFDPFWEFVAGPLHAGTFGPNALDDTFGPKVMFQKHPAPGQGNLPPSDGMQFMGGLEVEPRSGALTVSLRDLSGKAVYTQVLEPRV